MEPAYGTALETVARQYEAERTRNGGKSLARVATIVVNDGKFFKRLMEGKPFLTTSLERVADWFRRPANWPAHVIPHDASLALSSIGRPPLTTGQCGVNTAAVACDRQLLSQRGAA